MFLMIHYIQADYEVTPDEKRKECGQEVLDKYLNPKVRLRMNRAKTNIIV